MARFSDALAPGKTELEVMAEAVHEMAILGCVDGIGKLSTAETGSNRPPTGRRFEPTDIVRLYLEAAGPAGYWAELGGVFSFREPPELLRRKFDDHREGHGSPRDAHAPWGAGRRAERRRPRRSIGRTVG